MENWANGKCHFICCACCQNGKQQRVNVLVYYNVRWQVVSFTRFSAWQNWNIQIKLTMAGTKQQVSITNLDWNLKWIIKCFVRQNEREGESVWESAVKWCIVCQMPCFNSIDVYPNTIVMGFPCIGIYNWTRRARQFSNRAEITLNMTYLLFHFMLTISRTVSSSVERYQSFNWTHFFATSRLFNPHTRQSTRERFHLIE